jgi:hypothetical protein
MKRLLAAFVLALLPATAANAAEPPPGKAPVLRHLAFTFKLSATYSHDARGVKDLGDPQGGNSVHYDDRQLSEGTIVCDVVAATADGGLIIDIREDSRDRQSAVARVAVRDKGQLVSYDSKRTLNEEQTVLLRLLGRNVIGAWERTVGETWDVENSNDKYKETTKFKVTAIPAPDDERVEVEQEYRFSGAESYAGAMHGKISFDRTKSVPRTAAIETRTRVDRMGQNTLVRYNFDFELAEDSFGKK